MLRCVSLYEHVCVHACVRACMCASTSISVCLCLCAMYCSCFYNVSVFKNRFTPPSLKHAKFQNTVNHNHRTNNSSQKNTKQIKLINPISLSFAVLKTYEKINHMCPFSLSLSLSLSLCGKFDDTGGKRAEFFSFQYVSETPKPNFCKL